MDIITGNVGWIEVICGPMFSGKSEELIRRLRRAMIARKRVEVFKPTIDNRYSDNETVSLGRPFPPIPDLLAQAESITKTLAICVRCGNPAKHTQRLRGSEDLIVVGAADMYEARCRRCFEPGIPKQTELEFVKAKRQAEKT